MKIGWSAPVKIQTAIIAIATCAALPMSAAGRAETRPDSSLPNLVPMFPAPSRVPQNFMVTNRLGGPTLEFEILTANIGGQDWIRPPVDRTVPAME